MEIALAAMNAEKRFDAMTRTRRAAKEVSRFTDPAAKAIQEAASLQEVFQIVWGFG